MIKNKSDTELEDAINIIRKLYIEFQNEAIAAWNGHSAIGISKELNAKILELIPDLGDDSKTLLTT